MAVQARPAAAGVDGRNRDPWRARRLSARPLLPRLPAPRGFLVASLMPAALDGRTYEASGAACASACAVALALADALYAARYRESVCAASSAETRARIGRLSPMGGPHRAAASSARSSGEASQPSPPPSRPRVCTAQAEAARALAVRAGAACPDGSRVRPRLRRGAQLHTRCARRASLAPNVPYQIAGRGSSTRCRSAA